MSFSASSAPDISESLPLELSRKVDAAVAASGGIKGDVLIGGLPFHLAASRERPYRRQTADFRKQQIDTSREAGEQTLDQWWTRSQDSWHGGAGINFYEPAADEVTANRFASSYGVDVWTRGQVTLLKRLDLPMAVSTGQAAQACGSRVAGVDYVWANVNGALKRYDGSTSATYTTDGFSAPVTHPVVGPSCVLYGTTFGIYKAALTGTAAPTQLWSQSLGTAPRVWWVKSRMLAGRGAQLFELTMAGGAWPTTPYWTHPDSAWTWSAVAEAPGAILAAGYANGIGSIYKIVLEPDAASSTPKLGQPIHVAAFPPGEEVHALSVYLGQYVGIGTSRGVRVGMVDGNGDLQYGPLVVDTAQPVKALTGSDRFLYAGVTDEIDGKSGAVRVDLSTEIEPLRFAWAWDVQAHATGTAESITMLGASDRVVLGVTGRGVYVQSANTFEALGSVTSGKIRYATTEPKSFRRVKVRADVNGGTVGVYALDAQAVEQSVIRLGSAFNSDEDIQLSHPREPQSHASLRLTLEPSADLLSSPRLDAVLLKALPSVRRQRLIQFPLLLTDGEKDRWNNISRRKGSAFLRLQALEALEDETAVVQVVDHTCDEAFLAQVERVELTRFTPPERSADNFGGELTVTVRRL